MPIRTCVACRRRTEKRDLLRWVVDAEGRPAPDPDARAPGRGGYVCRTEECVERLSRRERRRGVAPEAWEAFRLAIRGDVPQNVAGETHEN